eukprot:5376702-Amphidinium_carterae.2
MTYSHRGTWVSGGAWRLDVVMRGAVRHELQNAHSLTVPKGAHECCGTVHKGWVKHVHTLAWVPSKKIPTSPQPMPTRQHRMTPSTPAVWERPILSSRRLIN